MKTRSVAALVLAGLILATIGLGGAVTAKESAVPGISPNDHNHFGQVWNGSGSWALLVQNAAAGGIGFYGNSYAASGSTYGVIGRSASPSGRGVYGLNASTTGATVGTLGVSSSSSGYGVLGDSNYRGVYGLSRAGGAGSVGTYGLSIATSGNGVLGIANNGTAAFGVWGTSTTGDGVVGISTASNGYGVYGISNYLGVYGLSQAGGTSSVGALGTSIATNGTGVEGIANSGGAAFGVWGRSTSGYAGYFSGKVQVVGNLAVTGAKSFVIDHPLDPANKYLYHSAVESPDMKNMYDGVAALDAKGEAWVDLPAWFGAINKDFRYQLTSIGAPGPNLYVAQEIQSNRFKIAGGKPGMKVSWQVTGIRNDPYAQQNRMQVEVDKADQERGKYLYPQGYGQPETKGMYYDRIQQAQSAAAGQKYDATQQKLATVGKDTRGLDPKALPAPEVPAAPNP